MSKLNLKVITIAALLAGGITTAGVVSCTKKVNTDTYAQFIGEWKVSDNCSGFETPSFKIVAGTNSYSVKMTYKMGYNSHAATTTHDSCEREITVTGLVNSDANKDYFSIGNQVVTDACGNNYTVSGGVSIKRPVKDNEVDSLKFTIVTTTTGVTTACNYTSYAQ